MITIWHNPRCSKSRQALELLRSRGVEPRVVEYLKTPPNPGELSAVIRKLGIPARELLRRKEAEYARHGLEDEKNEKRIVEAMFHHPNLIERPVIFDENSAVIGRPPEAALKLI